MAAYLLQHGKTLCDAGIVQQFMEHHKADALGFLGNTGLAYGGAIRPDTEGVHPNNPGQHRELQVAKGDDKPAPG